MKLIAIVAATENNVIGINNKMPWHLPDDFKFFKKTTMGFPIIMGKNTWLSLGKALPGRENIVISTSLPKNTNVQILNSKAAAIAYIKRQKENTAFIIGGGKIYKEFFSVLDEIYMTRIHTHIENGAVFFPEIDLDKWTLTWQEYHPKDDAHQYDFTFQHWKRK